MLQAASQAAVELPVTLLSSADALPWLAPLRCAAAGMACLVFAEPAAPAHQF